MSKWWEVGIVLLLDVMGVMGCDCGVIVGVDVELCEGRIV